MYLQEITNILQGHEVKIKYDCDGGYENCGQEKMLKLKYAEKNIRDNDGKHICRKCQLKNKNPMKKKEIRDKVKRTCVERYGSTLPINSQDNIEKRREKFQDEEYKRKWVEKHKQTSLERYGVEHPMHSESVKEKQRQTMQENHGVDHPYQSPEIMAKMKANNMEKYGVENVAELAEVQIKMAQTTLRKYGVEHYNQLPEMKDYLRKNCREWLAESYAAGGPNKGVPRLEEWNQKQRNTVLELILDGKWKSGHKNSWRGYYTSIGKCKRRSSFFRSGFELIYHHYLDTCQQVEWYDYEPFAISYEINGKFHNYIPDFLVKFKNDDVLYIREVKADYLHDSVETKSKYEAARNFVKMEINMNYSVLLKQDIYSLGIDFKSLKQQINVVIVHEPKTKKPSHF
jgi:hypothetical protein